MRQLINRKFVLSTDEAECTINGIFNFHNNHLWAGEIAHTLVQKSHHGQLSLNVYGAIK